MGIKITSDGTPHNTKAVMLKNDGEEVEIKGLRSIKYEVDASGNLGTATLVSTMPAVTLMLKKENVIVLTDHFPDDEIYRCLRWLSGKVFENDIPEGLAPVIEAALRQYLPKGNDDAS